MNLTHAFLVLQVAVEPVDEFSFEVIVNDATKACKLRLQFTTNVRVLDVGATTARVPLHCIVDEHAYDSVCSIFVLYLLTNHCCYSIHLLISSGVIFASHWHI